MSRDDGTGDDQLGIYTDTTLTEAEGLQELELVEARVHMAAANYHSNLASGKLVPRPPNAPRMRPASAGVRGPHAVTRPNSASQIPFQSGHSRTGKVEQLKVAREKAVTMEGATDALAALMGPWGSVRTDGPSGVISSALQDISEMLTISAEHSRRKNNVVKTSRGKFIPRIHHGSTERLHASIIGRSLGRSFANVLLMTKVFLALREVKNASALKAELERRRGRQRNKARGPDHESLLSAFLGWCHANALGRQRREVEAEITRCRHALVDVWARGRKDLARAVDCLHARIVKSQIGFCLYAWRDALFLQSLDRYSNLVHDVRSRTSTVVDRCLTNEALVLACLVCWAGSCALMRQGRLLEDSENSFAGAVDLASERQRQLLRAEANKTRLAIAGRGQMSRGLETARVSLLQLAFHEWHFTWQSWVQASRVQNMAFKCKLQLQKTREKSLVYSTNFVNGPALLQAFSTAWHDHVQFHKKKQRALQRGIHFAGKEDQGCLSQFWHLWLEILADSKAQGKKQAELARKREAAERSFQGCSRRLLQEFWEIWRVELQMAKESQAKKEKAMFQAAKEIAASDEFLMLRVLAAWRADVEEMNRLRALEVAEKEAEARRQEMAKTALQRNLVTLEKQQGRANDEFVATVFVEWRTLTDSTKLRKSREEVAMKNAVRGIKNSEDSLISECVLLWKEEAEKERLAREREQAVKNAQESVHQKTVTALRRKADAEAETLLLLHFLAWNRFLLESKISRGKKDRGSSVAHSKMLVAGEMLRGRCFSAWVRATRDARQAVRDAVASCEAAASQSQKRKEKKELVTKSLRSALKAALAHGWSGWKSYVQAQKQRQTRLQISQAVGQRRSAENDEWIYLRCFAAWYCGMTVMRHEKDMERAHEEAEEGKLAAVERILGSAPVMSMLSRQIEGGDGSGSSETFQTKLLWKWHALVVDKKHREGLSETRCAFAARAVEDQANTLLLVAFEHWFKQLQETRSAKAKSDSEHAMHEAVKEQRFAQARLLISKTGEAVLSFVLSSWNRLTVEARREIIVANVRQQARDMQLRARGQKLEAMDGAEKRLDQAFLLTVLLRWNVISKSRSLRKLKKEQAMERAEQIIAANDEALLSCCVSVFSSEASAAKQERFLGEIRRQVESSSERRARSATAHKKAVAVLKKAQSSTLTTLMKSVLRSWCRVIQIRTRQRKLSSSVLQRYGAEPWLLTCTVACWALAVREARAWSSCTRCISLGRMMAVRLRQKLLLQQALRAWQHACCYEELLRILSDTQADLKRAADAAAVAESAAAVAVQRNRGVTVRVLNPNPSSKSAWPISHVPSTVTVFPMESYDYVPQSPQFGSPQLSHVGSNFQAPVDSLQQDIERHYGTRLQVQGRQRPQSAGQRRIHHDAQRAIEVASNRISEESYRDLLNQSREALGC